VHSPETGGRPAERKIGEVLIEQGTISREQPEEALEVQKTNEKYVGRILVSLGYLGEEDLARGTGPAGLRTERESFTRSTPPTNQDASSS
jgi:hypothetical protein